VISGTERPKENIYVNPSGIFLHSLALLPTAAPSLKIDEPKEQRKMVRKRVCANSNKGIRKDTVTATYIVVQAKVNRVSRLPGIMQLFFALA
jgi:hypothetical protein